MVIGIYGRKSLYSDKSDSVRNQLQMGREYALSRYEDPIIIEYEDEGYTGANTIRPGFIRLENDIKKKKIDVLICYKIDRLSRNVHDFSSLFNILQKNKIEFVSLKEQIDTTTPLGRAMMYLSSVFAQMERETTAERVRDNMIELAKLGVWVGGKAPIGYEREKVTLNGKIHTKLAENKNEIPHLLMIYNTFLQGYSLGGLETLFRKSRVKTLNGSYFSASQLYQILITPHYVPATYKMYNYFADKGCIMAVEKEKFNGKQAILIYGRTSQEKGKPHIINPPDKWIVTVGLHKPIIDEEKWLSVQERFGKNKIDKTRKYEIGILKSIVKCECGYTMRVQHKVDKVYRKVYDNYYCQNRNRRGTDFCNMKMVRVDKLDSKLIDTLKQFSVNKDLLKKHIQQQQADIIIPLRDKDSIKKEIVTINKKIGNLTATLQENMESSASKYIINEIEKLDKQLIGLNYELRELEIQQQEISKQKDDIDTIYTKITNYLKNFDSLIYSDKVKYLQEILRECTWDGRQLFITI